MSDWVDAAQDLQQRETDAVLARHQQRHVRARLTHCERHDCGEPVMPERTRLGARLCVDCEEEDRKRAAHFATWSQAWR